MQKAILVSLLTVGLLASVIGVGTYAFFSDTETSMGNTMTAGTLDLEVEGQNPLVKQVVTLTDLKPSFTHYADPIQLKIIDNPGKLYKMITNIVCEGGTNPEPEWAVDKAPETNNQFTDDTWFDLHIGWTDKEQVDHGIDCLMGTEYKVGQLANRWIYLGEYPAMTPVIVKQSFHMDKFVGNEHQGDKCTFDEVFMVLQTNDPGPQMGTSAGDLVVDCTD